MKKLILLSYFQSSGHNWSMLVLDFEDVAMIYHLN
jgi:hypothetical protein